MKHFVLVPGYVHSQHDEDRHYISWQQLQKLYKLQRHQFSIHRGHVRGQEAPVYDPPLPQGVVPIMLYPQASGNYTLPE